MRRTLTGIVPLLCAALAACAASAPPPGAAATGTATVAAQQPTPEQKPARPKPPLTHVEMKVLEVVATRQGAAVLLVDEAGDRALPIFIGGTEALSIALRHEHRRYDRPLTHDLLDTVMERLGGELVKVQVDELRDGVFIGTVYVRTQQGKRTIAIDARPSDAIALALGHDVPIFVARQVLDVAGVSRKDLEGGGEGPKLPPPPPGGVERL